MVAQVVSQGGDPAVAPAIEQALTSATPSAVTDFAMDVSLQQDALPAFEEDEITATHFSTPLSGKTIAIAQDAAFSFIYPANLNLLETLGAKLTYFSPLANQPLPPCEGLWLPGGYPELHINTLTKAEQTRTTIRRHQSANKPILAECGGMMYLCKTITNVDGVSGTGCGLFDAHCHQQNQHQSIGLQSIDYGNGKIKCHSFHHSKLVTTITPERYGIKQNGEQGEAIYRAGKTILTYVHHYFPSNPAAVAAIFG
ncbi:Cobyrinic acid A,C-diamide synthase [uncultured Candidatus Thioglobus sp.]|nr:Cobyrinic acid A,C-diamide synthase [uncultured Candidatus Thioglobus sp.]